MQDIALSQVVGSLSYALDITEGQPPGHALRSCMIGMRLAEAIGLPAGERSDLFYALLLKDAGCSANAERMAALFGADDVASKRTFKLVDWSRPTATVAWVLRTVAPGGSLRERARRVNAIREEGDVARGFMEARCERGAEIARMLYLSDPTADAIRALDEHWDGRGLPAGLRGEEIPLAARILCLAQTVEVFHARGGVRAVERVARRRRGRWFDPALVDALLGFCDDASFWAGLGAPDVSAWEPAEQRLTADALRLDRIAEAFARVIDAKSPYTARHSERVAEIAESIGRELGFGPGLLRDLRRAGLLHDIGKLAISNRILDKPGKLTDEEFALVKTHPLQSLRILERAQCFAALAPLAAAHHEKLDGSGYPFGLTAEALDLPMRVLAVADIYEALTALRPYRGPMAPEAALEIIRRDVPHKLDARAVEALEAGVGAIAPVQDPGFVATVQRAEKPAAPPRDGAPAPPRVSACRSPGR